ncbi:PASTA domain-containing protein [Granulicella aggregans]|uniref:PASTA domain-containing protein n=1 Tax=Granulicella aggregans TaxID=474949 RepID=UPI0021E01263|nr:PASTA domain-containing protein [Granulicella aggregans]
MRRFFNIALGALAMIAVAMMSAFITMRLAIHGREVEVPSVAGLTVDEARSLAEGLGLNMDLESQFYSTTIPSGHILSQSPTPGTKVRRDWVLRVAESIGPQKVSIPNVVGQTEREATVTIRRLALDLGTIAYVPSPGPPGIVVSQSPTPDAAGVDGPRISLLVSEPIPTPKPHVATFDDAPGTPSTAPASSDDSDSASTDTTSEPNAEAYVMPDLIGLTLTAASSRVAAMGLKISSMNVVPAKVKAVAPIGGFTSPAPTLNGQPAPIRPIAPIAPITPIDTVIAQKPAAGARVTANDKIHITLSH